MDRLDEVVAHQIDLDHQHDPDEIRMRDRLRGRLFGGEASPVRIGRYVIVERVGAGGLGVVYSAYDPELDRKVAVKLMAAAPKTGETAEHVQERMRREARAMAKLAHPNVVAVYDVGSHGDGVFVAMELVQGVTFEQWTAAQRRSWKQVRDVAVGAAAGLQAAHQQSIVHRDFKPQNVLVDPAGHARVLDFGLARLVGGPDRPVPADVAIDGSLTRTGAVIGTPAYMAPEQARGDPVDPRADQFSFCVTIWEALYGQRPFAGGTLGQLLAAIMRGNPQPDRSTRPVPTWLRAALQRGLQADPAARFESMDALCVAMSVDRRSRRRQLAAAVLLATLSASAAAVAAVTLRPGPEAAPTAQIDALADRAHEAAARSYFLYPPSDAPDEPTAYSTVVEIEAVEGDAAELAQTRASELRAEFSQTLVRLGDSYWERPGGQGFAADYYAAALIFTPGHSKASQRSVLTPGELAVLRTKAQKGGFSPAELAGGDALSALAEPDEARRRDRVSKLMAGKRSLPVSTSVHLQGLVGPVSSKPAVPVDPDPGDAPPPPPGPEDAGVERAEPTPAPGKPHDRKGAAAEVARGQAAFRRGAYSEAETHFHRALAMDPRAHRAMVGLSELHFERGAYQKAVRYGRRAVSVAPRVARYHRHLGDAYFKVVRYDDARKAYRKAKALGDPKADAGLQRLGRRLGGPK